MKKETTNNFSCFTFGVLFVLQVLLFLISFTGVSLATFCDSQTLEIMGNPGEDLGNGQSIYREKIIFGVPGATNASDAFIGPKDAELAKSEYNGGSCVAALCYCMAPDFTVLTCSIKCSTAWVQAHLTLEAVTTDYGVVNNVPFGSEKSAAETYFQTFNTATSYRTLEGFVRTDGLAGYIYSSAMGANNQSATVSVNVWKRGGYAPVGNVTSLENLTGQGGGGGGITQAQTTTAVGDALTNKNLTGDYIRQGLDNSFDRAYQSGYFSATGGGQGGLSLGDTQTAVKNALDDKFPLAYSYGSYGSGDAYSVPYTHEAFSNIPSLTDSWSAFKTDMSDAPVVSLANNFFTAEIPSGEAAVVAFNTTSFGNQSFHFSQFGSILVILRSVVLLAFAYVSVKIVLKGGGG